MEVSPCWSLAGPFRSWSKSTRMILGRQQELSHSELTSAPRVADRPSAARLLSLDQLPSRPEQLAPGARGLRRSERRTLTTGSAPKSRGFYLRRGCTPTKRTQDQAVPQVHTERSAARRV